MFLLAGLVISFASLIGIHQAENVLYLPGKTTYKLSVNPNEHSGIEFTVVDNGCSSHKGIVQFISSPQNESNVDVPYNVNSTCELHTKDGINCTIVRYWPPQTKTLLRSKQSYLTCQSYVKNSPVYVNWKWISLRPEQNNHGLKFACPESIPDTHKCLHKGQTKIPTDWMLNENFVSDPDTIMIQFCTTKEVATVDYMLHFEEEVPNIQSGQHNMYTMDLSKECTITVPLVKSEQYLYIVTKETNTTELTLKYIRKTTDTQLTHRLYIPRVFYSFLALVAFVCFLQFLVLLLLCKNVKCVRIYKQNLN